MKADEATIEILIDLGAEITKENIKVQGFFVKVERVKNTLVDWLTQMIKLTNETH